MMKKRRGQTAMSERGGAKGQVGVVGVLYRAASGGERRRAKRVAQSNEYYFAPTAFAIRFAHHI